MGGVIFHEKQGTLTDCYKAWGTITLPAASNMLATTFPTFVSYVLFGCHRDGVGNFDAGLQVCGGNQYELCLNGGKLNYTINGVTQPEQSVTKRCR